MPFKKLLVPLRLLYHAISRMVSGLAQLAMLVASFCTIGLLIYNFGFGVDKEIYQEIHITLNRLLLVFFISYILRLLFNYNQVKRIKGRWLELTLFIMLFVTVGMHFIIRPYFGGYTGLGIFSTNTLSYILLFILSVIEISRWSLYLLDRTFNPSLLFVFSFLFIILAGAFLLKLPNATVDGIRFLDALFTSTSAVCVTGLVVVDTATAFTPLGQLIIILLIQIGGIGIVTFTTFFALFFSEKSSFHNQMVVRDLISGDSLNGIFRTLINIVLVTLSLEAIGTLLVYFSIHGKMGMDFWDELAFAAFHSISAYCNAGFSTLSGNLYDPLVRTNYTMHTLIAMLIILGGIGFPIVFNYWRLARHYIQNSLRLLFGRQKTFIHLKIISVNSRLAMITTIVLLVIGTGLFFGLEYDHALNGLSPIQKLAVSFFNAVTPRTAGFNNIDLTTCLHSSLFVIILLMWIGASPMSTGGGIKTTTFALMFLNLISTIRGKNKVEIARREVRPESINRAYAVVMLSLVWLAISIFLLSVFEPQADLLTIIYECVSALSTVGLSLNFSPTLSDPSRIVIIITMFVGRVGLITILTGIVRKFTAKSYSYPSETVMV